MNTSSPGGAPAGSVQVSAPGPTRDVVPVRRALVSVFDKSGLEELVLGLHEAGVELVSTGGSAERIAGLGLPVTRVEQLTGFPECLEGRVKTLHPRVHAGLLGDLRKPEHVDALADLGIEPIGLVVVNLYPFQATVASGASAEDCVENIDVGGPAMVRAAAKNHPSVAVLTDPAQYAAALAAVRGGGFTFAQRRRLAAEAFAHTAAYDVAVAAWIGSDAYADTGDGTGFPHFAGATFQRVQGLRYGENPHQRAALYRSWRAGIASGILLHGKEMSYNNYVDADAALRAATDHGDQPTCAVVKHANPCGIAVGQTVAVAHRRAHECDPVSAFGGVIAVNRPVTLEMAQTVADIFTEVVVAPAFDAQALAVLTRKKNIRLLQVDLDAFVATRDPWETRAISGGLLVQAADRLDAVVRDDTGAVTGGDDPTSWRLAAGAPVDAATLADLAFAWRAVRAVKSNAILLARDGASVGVGMGQVNRVDSCRLAVQRAGAQRARGSVAASDAFFPFADGPGILIEAGVRAIVQPGGSIRDQETIDACAAAGVTLYLTGTRHFAH